MAENEEATVKQSPEPVIEPYYQGQGKYLVDTLFDLGCLSESLSRDGLVKVEDLAALMFQQIADSANRCATFTKKYKAGHIEGERVRHEEEMRWIERAKEAEGIVSELSVKVGKQQAEIERLGGRLCGLFAREGKADAAWAWARDVGDLLRRILSPFAEGNLPAVRRHARGMIERGIEQGILSGDSPFNQDKYCPGVGLKSNMEEVCRPENPCHGEVFEGPIKPGEIINVCPKCGGRIL